MSITDRTKKFLVRESEVLGMPQQELLSRLIEDYEAAPSVLRRGRLRLLPEDRQREIVEMELRHLARKRKGK